MEIKEFKNLIKTIKKQLKSFRIEISCRQEGKRYIVNIESPVNPIVSYNSSPTRIINNLVFIPEETSKVKVLKEIEFSVHTIVDFFIWSREGNVQSDLTAAHDNNI